MKRNILHGCRDTGIVLCQVGPQDTLYWWEQPQESRDAQGVGRSTGSYPWPAETDEDELLSFFKLDPYF